MKETTYTSPHGKRTCVKKLKSQNDLLSEKWKETLKEWKEQEYKKFRGDNYDDLMKTRVRYIIKDGKARKGGVLIQNAKDYIVLKNVTLNRERSV